MIEPILYERGIFAAVHVDLVPKFIGSKVNIA